MRKALFLSIAFVFMLLGVAVAQDRTVTGTVTDGGDSSPLPGVNVVIKGTSTGTVTDANGKYQIKVADNATLVFSFVGYKQMEVAVGAQSVIDVALAVDAVGLDEVVVTALGIEKTKNELTYAAQKVGGDEVAKTRDNNITNALSGKVSGVEIRRNNSMGGSTNIVVRGNKSISGNNQALFVIDGVPVDNSNTNGANQQTGRGGYDYGNAAADINPDDVASINVLKGAAATALYGSRAANGVVMITIKKGSKGLGITINTGVTRGSIDKSTFATFQDKYGAGYGPYYEDASGFFLERDVDGDGNPDLVVPFSEDASYGARFDANKMVYQWDAFDPGSPNYGKKTPWVAAANGPIKFMQNPVSVNNSIMIDGGSDKGHFKLGYTRTNEKGLMPNSGLDKDYLSLGAGYNITDKLKATANISMTKVKGLGRYGTGYDDKNLMTNFRQWWQTNVDVLAQEEAYMRNRENITWNWTDPTVLKPIYWDNPYFTRYENYQNDNRFRTLSYAMLNYQATSWLSMMGRVSLDAYDEFQEERQAVGSVTPSFYTRFNRSYREYNYDFMANFDKKFGDISVKGLVGANSRQTHVSSIFTSTNGGLVVPRLYSISNSLNPINPPTEADARVIVNGYFGGASVGFKDFLFAEYNLRYDVASTLPSGKNGYPYSSLSLGFVFAELLQEKFDWLSGGKLRVNMATVGNSAAAFSIYDTYDKPTAFGSTPLFSVNGTKLNNNLKNEDTKSFEVGLEMGFFDNRVGFDVTYYKQNSINQIIPVAVSRATGYNSKFINAGDVQNKGIEVSLYGSPIRTDNFTWTINANWTRNRNEVLELTDGVTNVQLGALQGGVSINAALGEPYGTIRGSAFTYDDNGNRVVGSNGRYIINASTNNIIGNVNPDWIGGVQNTLKYKGASLSFLVDVRHGGDLFSLDMYYGLATGLYPETAGNNDLGNPLRSPLADGGGVILDGVKQDGTKNDIRVSAEQFGLFGYRRNPAQGFIYDASYIKLRELALSYNLPTGIVSKLGPVRGIEISVVGRNLWIIHKNLPYADPEEGMSSGNIQGYQVGAYPTTRNLGFNLKVKF